MIYYSFWLRYVWLCVSVWLCRFVCVLECSNKWVSVHAGSSMGRNRCEFACELSTCACVRQAVCGCVYTCGCGATHSCTAGHAFSAASCRTMSRWHSWKKSLAPNHACCCSRCCTLSLLSPSPSPSLSAALFLGSYPAEQQEKQTQREVFICKFVCSLSLWYILHGMTVHNHVRGRMCNRVRVGRSVTCVNCLHLRILSL